MGKAISSLGKRTTRNWNITNRAIKEIERTSDRPKPAPRRHETPAKQNVFESSQMTTGTGAPDNQFGPDIKNEKLDDWLKKVHVESHGPPPQIKASRKSLPENRKKYEDPEFGYLEPDTIPEGKCTIRQVMEFISHHQENPEHYGVKEISQEYKLDPVYVEQVLKYFCMYNLHIPKDSQGRQMLGQAEAKPLKKLLSGYRGKLLGDKKDLADK